MESYADELRRVLATCDGRDVKRVVVHGGGVELEFFPTEPAGAPIADAPPAREASPYDASGTVPVDLRELMAEAEEARDG